MLRTKDLGEPNPRTNKNESFDLNTLGKIQRITSEHELTHLHVTSRHDPERTNERTNERFVFVSVHHWQTNNFVFVSVHKNRRSGGLHSVAQLGNVPGCGRGVCWLCLFCRASSCSSSPFWARGYGMVWYARLTSSGSILVSSVLGSEL